MVPTVFQDTLASVATSNSPHEPFLRPDSGYSADPAKASAKRDAEIRRFRALARVAAQQTAPSPASQRPASLDPMSDLGERVLMTVCKGVVVGSLIVAVAHVVASLISR